VHSWQQELHKLVHKRQQLERSWQQERHKLEHNPCCSSQLEHSSLDQHHSYHSTVA